MRQGIPASLIDSPYRPNVKTTIHIKYDLEYFHQLVIGHFYLPLFLSVFALLFIASHEAVGQAMVPNKGEVQKYSRHDIQLLECMHETLIMEKPVLSDLENISQSECHARKRGGHII